MSRRFQSAGDGNNDTGARGIESSERVMDLPHIEEESELEEAVRTPHTDPRFSESAILFVFVAIIGVMGLGLFQLLAH
jgi:hypothetical protein